MAVKTVSLVFVDGDDPGFDLLSFKFQDDMSALFSLDLMVQSASSAIELTAIVGKRVALLFGGGSLLPRVTGIVREVKMISTEQTGASRYVLFVVPPLWLTTRRVNHRVFQNRTAVQIVQDVLADYGSRMPAAVESFQGSYRERAYCVQYGETDHDFIFRLLADEGIAAFFDHADTSRWTLVDPTTLKTKEITPAIPVIEGSVGNAAPVPSIQTVVITGKIKTSAVAVRDYDHTNPAFLIKARETAKGAELFVDEKDLEAYSFNVGDARTEEQAKDRAQRLLDGARMSGRRLEMTLNTAVGAGNRIEVTGHVRDDVNKKLLVIRASAIGHELGSSQHIECIDADVPFRPRRKAAPRIIGTQTAFVVATTKGDEIDADELGQVKIEFRWDRRDLGVNTSRYVRVSQAWAGPDYGFICLPRVGDEVIVEFLDGDPDEPIIIGRVHNVVNVRPFKSKGEQTISVWRSRSSPGGKGFNQILLDDKAGAERLELHAQRDSRSETGHNSVTTVAVNESKKVGGCSSTHVAGSLSISSGSTSISTGACSLDAHDIKETSKTNISVAAADQLHESSVNHFVDTQGLWVHAGSIVQVVTPLLHVMSGNILLDAGGSSIEIKPGGIKIVSGGTVEVNGAVVDVKGTPIKLNS